MIVLAEQTQFPVGQGGLHLTQLSIAEFARRPPPYNSSLSIIYDCGGKGGGKALDRSLSAVRQSLPLQNGRRHLEMLVLSHLHDDHISGFERLIGAEPLSIDTLLIPHYDDLDRLLLIVVTAFVTGDIDAVVDVADATGDPAGWFGERGVRRVIGIRPDEPDDTEPSPSGPERTPEGYSMAEEADRREPFETPSLSLRVFTRNDPRTQDGTYETLRCGAFLQMMTHAPDVAQVGTDWVLLPYCQRNLPREDLQSRQPDFKRAVDAILAPFVQGRRLVVPPAKAKDLISCLVDAFLCYVPNKQRDWNILSLSLFNGLGKARDLHAHHAILHAHSRLHDLGNMNVEDTLYFRLHPSGWLMLHHMPFLYPGRWVKCNAHAWMMTGDSVLTAGAPAWRKFYANYLDRISVFQVPHHGSRYNFDSKFPLPASTRPFVTCKVGDKDHPSPSVVAVLQKMNLNLLEVTHHLDSMIYTLIAFET